MADPNLTLQLDLFEMTPAAPRAKARGGTRRATKDRPQLDLFVPASEKRTCANPECDYIHFTPRSRKQKYCSTSCRSRHHYLLHAADYIQRSSAAWSTAHANDLANRPYKKCLNPSCKKDIRYRRPKTIYCSLRCAYTSNEKHTYRMAYAEIKRDEINAWRRKYYRDNRERVIENNKAYRERNKEQLLERSRKRWSTIGYIKEKGLNPDDIPVKAQKCENPFCDNTKVCLDHDHASSTFRGWLCARCNSALGFGRDSPLILRGLAEYLEQRGFYGSTTNPRDHP